MAGGALPVAADRRLDELAAEHGLDGDVRGRLADLLGLLASTDHASTTVREPGRAVDVHVADALTGLAVPAVREAGRLADLGAGAGFPGLVLAVVLPHVRVALVESVARRLAFPSLAAEALGLDNLECVPERAEGWSAGLGACDVVTARALAPLGVIAEYAAPLLREGGSLVAWKAELDDGERRTAAVACEALGLELPVELPTNPWAGARTHRLVQARKISPTPERFPRREGMARKKPLGA